MSTQQDKVTAAYDFLANRASLGRTTSHQELGVALGPLLMARAQRRIDRPVRREKVKVVLAEVDKISLERNGVLLSPLVPHFWDGNVGNDVRRSASRKGIDLGSPDKVRSYQGKIFSAFPSFVEVSQTPPAPARETVNTSGGYDDELAALAADLKRVNERFDSYVGRHRNRASV
jgi:hypothetical protein